VAVLFLSLLCVTFITIFLFVRGFDITVVPREASWSRQQGDVLVPRTKTLLEARPAAEPQQLNPKVSGGISHPAEGATEGSGGKDLSTIASIIRQQTIVSVEWFKGDEENRQRPMTVGWENRQGGSSADIRETAKQRPLVKGYVFYGRRRYVQVLNCYLERNLAENGGLLSEVIFVSKTQVRLKWCSPSRNGPSKPRDSTIELSQSSSALLLRIEPPGNANVSFYPHDGAIAKRNTIRSTPNNCPRSACLLGRGLKQQPLVLPQDPEDLAYLEILLARHPGVYRSKFVHNTGFYFNMHYAVRCALSEIETQLPALILATLPALCTICR
jgi:hypothetical protein